MKNVFQLLVALFFIGPHALLADVSLNPLFSNHMVIQRETIIPIWGWADADEIVTVETSWGASAQVITNQDGTWRANIQTPRAGGPHQIIVFSKNRIEINDVLSGDVWLCTGQSNMDFAMEKFVNDSRDPQHQPLVEYIRHEVATAQDDWIRHIEVPQTTSLFEKKFNFKANWRSVNPEQIGKITATGYFFAKELRKHLNVPIGLLECSWGGTRVQPWISEAAYFEDENMKAYFEASRAGSRATIEKMDAPGYVDKAYQKELAKWEKKGGKGKKPKPATHPTENMQLPATLHNGMISAIVPFAIKGAIWYQGESNAVYMANEYEHYFSTMITSWRKEWNQGDFSFYWAQLASCKRGNDEADKGWATVNDQLRRTLKLPHTGMAVLHDIGEAKDIHPHNKMDAGKRLAFWALQKDYNLNIDVVSGPLYKQQEVKGNKMQIEFDEVGTGLMVGNKHLLEATVKVNEPLKSFEIVGQDGKWLPAEAKIISNSKIEVWSASVPNPVNVRYAWSGTPDGANLYNNEGLPAAVFTTEN
ncbi:sialate O-acetylesterase [Mariniflexile ostreae]|uniref:Sialate O-acetylesterase n=1 Tax=Mariniflexile ostreae TaxID=1520892 RepID=A0ABV5FB61_9FLAO